MEIMTKSKTTTTTAITAAAPCPYKTVSAETAMARVAQMPHDPSSVPTVTAWCAKNFDATTAPNGENFKRYRGKLRGRFIHGKNTSWHATADVLAYLASVFPLFRLSTDKTVSAIAIAKHGALSK